MKNSTKKIKEKVIASSMAFLLTFSNFGLLGNGIMQVVAKDNVQEPKELNTQIAITKYVQYRKENYKGVFLKTVLNMSLNENQENHVPTLSNKIEIEVPKINENLPTVEVVANSTENTNGKVGTEVEFNEKNWNYDSNSGLLTISYDNKEEFTEFRENSKDEFEIVYSYPEASYTGHEDEIELPVKVNIEKTLNNEEQTKITKTLEDDNVKLKDKIGNIVTYNIEETSEIYKGYLYVNKETEFTTKDSIEIINTNLIDSINVVKNANTYYENEKEANIEYKTTKISKDDFDKILGENGILEIWAGEEKILSVKYEETDEGKKLFKQPLTGAKEEVTDIITLEYKSGIKAIDIRTSKPKTIGKIEIENTKIIKPDEGLQKVNIVSEIITVSGIKNEVKKVEVDGQEQEEILPIEICYSKQTNEIKLKEPVNGIEVEFTDTNGNTNGTISPFSETQLTYVATLRNDSSKYKLLNNPTITLTIPKEITGKFTKPQIVQGTGLEIGETTQKINEDGSKTITINIKGKQEKYTNSITEGIKLVMTLVLTTTSNIVPTQTTAIKTVIENNGTKGEVSTPIQIQSKSGLLVLSEYTGYNGDEQKTIIDNNLSTNLITVESEAKTLMQKINLVNNYEEEISNIEIIGTLGYTSGEEKSTFITKLKTILSSNEKVKILYSEDGQNWIETVEDISKVISYKIVIEKMEKAEVITIDSQLLIPANLENNEISYINNNIKYVINGEEKEQNQTIKFYTAIAEEILPDVGSGEGSEEQEGTDIAITTKTTIAGKEISAEDEVYQGQIVRYYVALKNNTTETKTINLTTNIDNGQYYEVVDTGIEYNPNMFATEYALASEDDLQRKETYTIEPGKTVIHEYQVRVKDTVDTIKTTNIVEVNGATQEKIIQNKVKPAKVAIETRYAYNEEMKVLSNGSKMPVIVKISNITDNELANLQVKVNIPEELSKNLNLMEEVTGEEYKSPYKEGKVKIENNQLIWNIDKIESKKTEELYVSFITEQIDTSIASKDISIVAITEIEKESYTSNDLIKTMHQTNENVQVSLTSSIEEGTIVTDKEKIEYTINVFNNGALNIDNLSYRISLNEGVEINKIILRNKTTNSEKEYNVDSIKDASINNIDLNTNEALELKIIAEINSASLPVNIDTINNEFFITTKYDSKRLNHTLKYEEQKQEDDDPEEDEDIEEDDVTPDIYSIGGVAWLDINKNATRDENEKILSNIKVMLIDANTQTIVENKDGIKMETVTDSNGAYKFENLLYGQYIVIFEYDTAKYSITAYKKENIEENVNSDVVSSRIQISGETKIAAITDQLELITNLENIDMGLIENAEFDLKLDKYISKVIVKNSQGTETKNYQNTNFAKVDLVAKYINSASVFITYKFVITNNGDVTGYVDKLSDNLPSGLEFSSELNKNWYKGSDGMLYTTLSEIAIEPGQSSEVELILTKQMNEDNTGTVTNTASLIQVSNLEGIEEKADQVLDNTSKADLLLTIKTGSPFMYISITLISISIIAGGAYLINKKVLNKEI